MMLPFFWHRTSVKNQEFSYLCKNTWFSAKLRPRIFLQGLSSEETNLAFQTRNFRNEAVCLVFDKYQPRWCWVSVNLIEHVCQPGTCVGSNHIYKWKIRGNGQVFMFWMDKFSCFGWTSFHVLDGQVFMFSCFGVRSRIPNFVVVF